MKPRFKSFRDRKTDLVHHYSQTNSKTADALIDATRYYDASHEAELQFREGKQIAVDVLCPRALQTWQRIVFMFWTLVFFAAVALAAGWVIR